MSNRSRPIGSSRGGWGDQPRRRLAASERAAFDQMMGSAFTPPRAVPARAWSHTPAAAPVAAALLAGGVVWMLVFVATGAVLSFLGAVAAAGGLALGITSAPAFVRSRPPPSAAAHAGVHRP